MAQYKSKFIDIDPYTCTQEELANALSMLHNLSGYYESKQLAVKLFINSVYGATASKYFVGHNTAVAESITLQGQDLNHYSENCVNKYFRGIFQSREHYDRVIYVPLFEWIEKWDIADTDAFYAKDANKNWVLVNLPIDKDIIVGGDFDKSVKDMLKKVFVKTTFGVHLGITYEQAAAVDINKGRVTDQLPLDYWAKRAKNPFNPKENPFAYMRKNSYLEDDPTTSMTIAGDTDSIYVEFGRISNQMGFIGYEAATRFVVDMWNYGCGPYMDECYEAYAKKYNCTKNLQALELEKIADTAIMVAKKHYSMSECFLEPNIYVKPGEHVLYKGLELIQGSCPPFARKCQDDFYRFVLNWYNDHTEAPTFEDIYAKIKKYKEDFIKQKPDDICKGSSISDYNKFIVDDNNSLVVGEHCPIHVRAAGVANYFLNMESNKKYKMKYNKIKTRDKIKFYKSTNKEFGVFAFLPNAYPIEYALPIDYNQQFEDLVLGPINRVLEILKYQPLTSDLCYTTALF